MDSRASNARMNSRRRRPLHTCGVSAIAMARKAYIKAHDLDELYLGISVEKRFGTFVSTISYLVYALKHFWLAIFGCVDDCTLAMENVVENFFPPSKHVFNKVDEIVEIIETLPAKFDDVLDKFPRIIEQVPFLDWILGQAISWLKVLTSRLTHCGSGNTKVKEIVVDTGYNESNGLSAVATDYDHDHDHEAEFLTEFPNQLSLNNEETFPPVCEKTENHEAGKVADQLVAAKQCPKGTYKEVLERGKTENTKKKEAKADEIENNPESSADVLKIEGDEDESSNCDDNSPELRSNSILDLFDSGWLMHYPVKTGTDGSLSSSFSYE